MDYKEKATVAYISNVKGRIPDISEYELAILETAFVAGFNIGSVKDRSELEQEIALTFLKL